MSSVDPATQSRVESTSIPSFELAEEPRAITVPLRTLVALMARHFVYARGGSNGAYLELVGLTRYHEIGPVTFSDGSQTQAPVLKKEHVCPGEETEAVAWYVSQELCRRESTSFMGKIDVEALRRKIQRIDRLKSYAFRMAAFDALLVSVKNTLGLPRKTLMVDIESVRLSPDYLAMYRKSRVAVARPV